MKVPRQCSVVLLVKTHFKKIFQSGDGKTTRSGARREAEENLTGRLAALVKC
jgi:hypothetical protein